MQRAVVIVVVTTVTTLVDRWIMSAMRTPVTHEIRRCQNLNNLDFKELNRNTFSFRLPLMDRVLQVSDVVIRLVEPVTDEHAIQCILSSKSRLRMMSH